MLILNPCLQGKSVSLWDGLGFSELLGGILANPQDLGGSCL
ncbi:hypothetical protein [Campylobacter upsaliensis]|nr:hypothetical protein [Campylobacter upsaliensis]MCR2116195.1 hypothetical protein [Campylobacter upsaliensis]